MSIVANGELKQMKEVAGIAVGKESLLQIYFEIRRELLRSRVILMKQ